MLHRTSESSNVKKIKMSVYESLKTNTITSLWTKKTISEYINNKPKEVADWKQHKISELINRLYSVIHGQLIVLRRALYGW